MYNIYVIKVCTLYLLFALLPSCDNDDNLEPELTPDNNSAIIYKVMVTEFESNFQEDTIKISYTASDTTQVDVHKVISETNTLFEQEITVDKQTPFNAGLGVSGKAKVCNIEISIEDKPFTQYEFQSQNFNVDTTLPFNLNIQKQFFNH